MGSNLTVISANCPDPPDCFLCTYFTSDVLEMLSRSLHDNVTICIRKEAPNMQLKDKFFSSFFSTGSGQEVTNVQHKDSGGPVGIPSLPPVQKKPGVQLNSTTSDSSREQSADDEVEGEVEMTQGTDPADVKHNVGWDVINHRKNGKLISVEMIFVDEKKNLIYGIMDTNQVNRLKGMLKEGSLFTIKNFKVVESTFAYRPIESPLTIILSASTVMNNLAEDVVDIPINGFQFIKPTMIDSRVNNHTVLSDAVGCLYEIGDIENCGSKGKIREIKIITDYFEKVKITLWEELGEKFDPSLNNKDVGPYIVIVTSTTVKEFCGEVSFFTTHASRIYVNLDIDYVRSLVQKFTTMSTEVQIIERYKIHVQVEDNTEKTTFVLFNDVAEKLLDTSAHKLFNKLSSLDNNDVPSHIQSLCGKDFIFKLKLNSYNLKEGLENFTVSKFWIADEKLELQDKLMKEKKNLIEDESEPKDRVPKELSTEKTWPIMPSMRSILPRSRQHNRTNKNKQKRDTLMVELLTVGNLYYDMKDHPKTNSLSQ
ncbi:hypothetical protein BC332_32082 [Capsicum chinense]|nr:hypothetical protein BC332_32082 [Capsicum chinense]